MEISLIVKDNIVKIWVISVDHVFIVRLLLVCFQDGYASPIEKISDFVKCRAFL